MTAAEHKSDFELTNDTSGLALSVLCEHLGENWPRYNGTVL